MRIRSSVIVACALLAAPLATSGAQGTARDSAYAVVEGIFDAMRARDTASLRAAFVPNASMQALRPQGVTFEPIDGWITSVAGAPPGLLLDERIANPVVQVNANLATVWVDYWFFAGERLSHCGVNAVQLTRLEGRWQIFSIVDTRQREGCSPAPAGTKPS